MLINGCFCFVLTAYMHIITMLLTCPTYSPQVAMAFQWMFQTPIPYSFSPFSSGALLGFEIAVSCGCIMYMVLRSRCEYKLCMQQTPQGVRIDIVPWRPLHLLARFQLVCLLACKSNWVPVPSIPYGLPLMLPMRIVAQYQRVPPTPPFSCALHPSIPTSQTAYGICLPVSLKTVTPLSHALHSSLPASQVAYGACLPVMLGISFLLCVLCFALPAFQAASGACPSVSQCECGGSLHRVLGDQERHRPHHYGLSGHHEGQRYPFFEGQGHNREWA